MEAPAYYHLHRQMGKGGHGDVWRALSSRPKHGHTAFVLKRLVLDR
eukprot:CAMPEP_0185173390 /NCGR_PEP_ID=MMETSP1139-20130426/23368_1 /TAXON_ID=298111 /ORGANISM="Pavlova sp., Strain CCMP459" /LENGTH=45 /DNA_ID= /DNA_START= /DNA_END= /DNA_ORIENTATION=